MDELGRLANALTVLVAVGFLIGGAVAWWRGAFPSDRKQFEARGYATKRAMGAVAPSPWLLAVLVGFSLILLPIFFAMVFGAVEMGWQGATLVFLAAPGITVWAFLLTYVFLRLWVSRRLAGLMRVTGSTPDADADEWEGPEPETLAPDACALEWIGLRGDPSGSKPDETAGTNGSDLPPLRILYLWNFDTGWTTLDGDIRSWRQYGPVYLLQSPQSLPVLSYFRLAFEDPERFFLTGPEDLDQRLAAADERPLPARRRGKRRARFPRIGLPCADGAWRDAIRRLCALADVVIVDARGYTRERAGLGWELRHVARSLAPERFLVLADLTTDVDLLEAQLRSVAGAAPADRGRIRIVDEARARAPHQRFDGSGNAIGCDYRADRLVGLLAPSAAG